MLCCNLLERYHCWGISFSDSSRRYLWWSVLTSFHYQNILSYFANASYMYREWIGWRLNVEISSLFSCYSSYLHYHIFIKVVFEQIIWISLSLLSFFLFSFYFLYSHSTLFWVEFGWTICWVMLEGVWRGRRELLSSSPSLPLKLDGLLLPIIQDVYLWLEFFCEDFWWSYGGSQWF